MPGKKQFSGTSKSRLFYDRKVMRTGYTRIISVGKIIPKDWRYVRLRAKEAGPNIIVIEITKLLGEEINNVKGNKNKREENSTTN